MDIEKQKKIFLALIALASIILMFAGVTFAYFSATVSSNENAVEFKSARLELRLTEDTSLVKSNLIPSAEEFVDIASKRVDQNGEFLKPYLDINSGDYITANTACIDDKLYEICSMYTFTIYNTSIVTDLPIDVYLKPNVNQFYNLYFKVLDSNLNEVVPKTKLVYNSTQDVYIENLNQILPKSTDSEHITSVTYTLVFWILEMGEDQTTDDSGKLFASTLYVKSSFNGSDGLAGTVSLAGTEG